MSGGRQRQQSDCPIRCHPHLMAAVLVHATTSYYNLPHLPSGSCERACRPPALHGRACCTPPCHVACLLAANPIGAFRVPLCILSGVLSEALLEVACAAWPNAQLRSPAAASRGQPRCCSVFRPRYLAPPVMGGRLAVSRLIALRAAVPVFWRAPAPLGGIAASVASGRGAATDGCRTVASMGGASGSARRAATSSALASPARASPPVTMLAPLSSAGCAPHAVAASCHSARATSTSPSA